MLIIRRTATAQACGGAAPINNTTIALIAHKNNGKNKTAPAAS
jgi:hypothetical protein